MDGITDLMDMNLSKLQVLVMDKEPGVLQSMWSQIAGRILALLLLFSAKMRPAICDHMDCSTPGFLCFTISQSWLKFMSIKSESANKQHPMMPSSVAPSPPAFSLSQHQGLFQGVSSSYQVAKVLELQFQHQSFQS